MRSRPIARVASISKPALLALLLSLCCLIPFVASQAPPLSNARLVPQFPTTNEVGSIVFSATELKTYRLGNGDPLVLRLAVIVLPSEFTPNFGGATICTVRGAAGVAPTTTEVIGQNITVRNTGDGFSTSPNDRATYNCTFVRTPPLSTNIIDTTVEFYDTNQNPRLMTCYANDAKVTAIGPGPITAATVTSVAGLRTNTEVSVVVSSTKFHSSVEVGDTIVIQLPLWQLSDATSCNATYQSNALTLSSQAITAVGVEPAAISIVMGSSIPSDAGVTTFVCVGVKSPTYVRPVISSVLTVWRDGRKRDETTTMSIVSVAAAVIGSTTRTLVPKYATAGTTDEVYLTVMPMRSPMIAQDTIYFNIPTGWLTNSLGETACSAMKDDVPMLTTTTISGLDFTMIVQEPVSDMAKIVINCTHIRTPLIETEAAQSTVTTYFGSKAQDIARAGSSLVSVATINPGNLTRYGAVTMVPFEAIINTVTNLVITIPQWQTPLIAGDRIVFVLPSTWEFRARGATTVCEVTYYRTAVETVVVPIANTTYPDNDHTIHLNISGGIPDGLKTIISCTNIRTPLAIANPADTEIWSQTAAGIRRDRTASAQLASVQDATLGDITATITPEAFNTGYFGNITIVIDPMRIALKATDRFRFTLPSVWTFSTGATPTICTISKNDLVVVPSTPLPLSGQTYTLSLNGPLSAGKVIVRCSNVRNPVYEVDKRSDITIDTTNSAGYVIERTITASLPKIVRSVMATKKSLIYLNKQVSGSTDTLFAAFDGLYNPLDIGDSLLVYMPPGWLYYASGQHPSFVSSCNLTWTGLDTPIIMNSTFTYGPDLIIRATMGVVQRVPINTEISLICVAIRAPLEGLPDWTNIVVETRSATNAIKDQMTSATLKQVTHIFDTMTVDLTSRNILEADFSMKFTTYINSPANDLLQFTLPPTWTWGTDLLRMQIEVFQYLKNGTLVHSYITNATTQNQDMNFTIMFPLVADSTLQWKGSPIVVQDPTLPIDGGALRIRAPDGFVRSVQNGLLRWPHPIRGIAIAMKLDGIDYTKLETPDAQATFRSKFVAEVVNSLKASPTTQALRENINWWGSEQSLPQIIVSKVEWSGSLLVELMFQMYTPADVIEYGVAFNFTYRARNNARGAEVNAVVSAIRTLISTRTDTHVATSWYYNQTVYTKLTSASYTPRVRGMYWAPPAKDYSITGVTAGPGYNYFTVGFSLPTNQMNPGAVAYTEVLPAVSKSTQWYSCEAILTEASINSLTATHPEQLRCQWMNATHLMVTTKDVVLGKGMLLRANRLIETSVIVHAPALVLYDYTYVSCLVAPCNPTNVLQPALFPYPLLPGQTNELPIVVEGNVVVSTCPNEGLQLTATIPPDVAVGGRVAFNWTFINTGFIGAVATYFEEFATRATQTGYSSVYKVPNYVVPPEGGDNLFPPDSTKRFEIMVTATSWRGSSGNVQVSVSKPNVQTYAPSIRVDSTRVSIAGFYTSTEVDPSYANTPILETYVSKELFIPVTGTASSCIIQPTLSYSWTHLRFSDVEFNASPFVPLPLDTFTRQTNGLRLPANSLYVLSGDVSRMFMFEVAMTQSSSLLNNPTNFNAAQATVKQKVIVRVLPDPPPSFVSAQLMSSGDRIQITFSSPTDHGAYVMADTENLFVPTATFCDRIFAPAMLPTVNPPLGFNPSCFFTAPNILMVQLGSNPRLTLESPNIQGSISTDIVLNKLGIRSPAPSFLQINPSNRPLLAPAVIPSPVVFVGGPSRIGPCDTSVFLDGRRSYGGFGRPLTYKWTFHGDESTQQATAGDDSVRVPLAGNNQTIVSFLSEMTTSTAPTLTIPSNMLNLADRSLQPSYAFGLTVTNWIGGSAIFIHRVRFISTNTPTVTVLGPTSIGILPTQRLSVRLDIKYNTASCGLPTPLSDFNVVWSSLPPIPSLATQSAMLDVAPGSMIGGLSYVFTAVVSPKSAPTVSTSVTVRVVVANPPLTAFIAGGAEQKVTFYDYEPPVFGTPTAPTEVIYTLDAAQGSLDPGTGTSTGLAYQWSCFVAPELTRPCWSPAVFDITNRTLGGIIPLTRERLMQLTNVNTTTPGRPLQFTVTVTKDDRSATYTQRLSIFSWPMIRTVISPVVSLRDSLVPTKFNRALPYTLRADVIWKKETLPVGTTSYVSGQKVYNFAFLWSVSPAVLDLTKSDITYSGATGPILAIRPGVLNRGMQLSFTCTVTLASITSTSMFDGTKVLAPSLLPLPNKVAPELADIEYFDPVHESSSPRNTKRAVPNSDNNLDVNVDADEVNYDSVPKAELVKLLESGATFGSDPFAKLIKALNAHQRVVLHDPVAAEVAANHIVHSVRSHAESAGIPSDQFSVSYDSRDTENELVRPMQVQGMGVGMSLLADEVVTDYDSGVSTVNMAVNEAPKGGSCTATSPLGVQNPTTVWTLSCTGFTDDLNDYPLQYRYFVRMPLGILNGTLVDLPLTTFASMDATQTVRLPPESTAVVFEVMDIWGAKAVYEAPVTVDYPFAFPFSTGNPAALPTAVSTVDAERQTLLSATAANDHSVALMSAQIISGYCERKVTAIRLEGVDLTPFLFACARAREDAAKAVLKSITGIVGYGYYQSLSTLLAAASLSSATPQQLHLGIRSHLTFALSNATTLLANRAEPLNELAIKALCTAMGSLSVATSLSTTVFTDISKGSEHDDLTLSPEINIYLIRLVRLVSSSVGMMGLSGASPASPAITVETPLMTIHMKRGTKESFNNYHLSLRPKQESIYEEASLMARIDVASPLNRNNNLTVLFSSSMIPATAPNIVDLVVVVINDNFMKLVESAPPYKVDDGPTQYQLSPLMQIDFFAAGTATKVPINSLTSPLYYFLPRTSVPAARSPVCRTYDYELSAWTTAGCTMMNFTTPVSAADSALLGRMMVQQTTPAVCACTHLSTFDHAAWYYPPLPPVIDTYKDVNGFNFDALINNPIPLIIFFVFTLIFVLGYIFAYIRDRTLDAFALTEMRGILQGISDEGLTFPALQVEREFVPKSTLRKVCGTICMGVKNHMWLSLCLRPKLSSLNSQSRLTSCFLFFFGAQAFCAFIYATDSRKTTSVMMAGILSACIVTLPVWILTNLQNHSRYNLFLSFGYNFLTDKYRTDLLAKDEKRILPPFLTYEEFGEIWAQMERELHTITMQEMTGRDVTHDNFFFHRLHYVKWREVVYKGTVPLSSVLQFLVSEAYWACYTKLNQDEFAASWSNQGKLAIVDKRMALLKSIVLVLLLCCGLFTIAAGTQFDQSQHINDGHDYTWDWLYSVAVAVAADFIAIQPAILLIDFAIWATFYYGCDSPFCKYEYNYQIAKACTVHLRGMANKMSWVDRRLYAELIKKSDKAWKELQARRGDTSEDLEQMRIEMAELRAGTTGMAVVRDTMNRSGVSSDDVVKIHNIIASRGRKSTKGADTTGPLQDKEADRSQAMRAEIAFKERREAKLKALGVIVDDEKVPEYAEVYRDLLKPDEKIMVVYDGRVIEPKMATMIEIKQGKFARVKAATLTVVEEVETREPKEWARQQVAAAVAAKRKGSIANALPVVPERTEILSKEDRAKLALQNSRRRASLPELRPGEDIYDIGAGIKSDAEKRQDMLRRASIAAEAAEQAARELEEERKKEAARKWNSPSSKYSSNNRNNGDDEEEEEDEDERRVRLAREKLRAQRQKQLSEVSANPTLNSMRQASMVTARRMSMGTLASPVSVGSLSATPRVVTSPRATQEQQPATLGGVKSTSAAFNVSVSRTSTASGGKPVLNRRGSMK